MQQAIVGSSELGYGPEGSCRPQAATPGSGGTWSPGWPQHPAQPCNTRDSLQWVLSIEKDTLKTLTTVLITPLSRV